MVKQTHIIVASRPINKPVNEKESSEASNYSESQFFLNGIWLSETNEHVQKAFTTELLFNKEVIKTCVIFCEFGGLKKTNIHLARQKKCKDYFIFGQTDYTDKLPKLLLWF